ncbi:hypothetical protein [Kitasatospora phosalacinea]|uniref:Uncharacterized protein n=1 Tax=Kitasatospora phosalacinea TaxID=2065 RepID=A0A9W6PJP4_9ACTN|nr:hypothetical protein [Kitasatospora phosalacinea]GLW56149.1 hypothetical protein Kpho01_41600 [Kitasatospora phosalacinea]
MASHRLLASSRAAPVTTSGLAPYRGIGFGALRAAVHRAAASGRKAGPAASGDRPSP